MGFTNPTPISPYAALDRIVAILGGTKMVFFPFLTRSGTDIFPYGSGNDGPVALSSDEAGVVALEAEFDPIQLNGVNAYYFDSSTNNHINGGDDADYSHGNGTVDTPFSVGCWILPTSVFATAQSLLAKYGSTANLEEWDFRVTDTASLTLELHDASASASESISGSVVTIPPWKWTFVVASYDGVEATPTVNLYYNGVADGANGAPNTTESGSYVAMEDTAAALLIGARDATGTPGQEFEGYMALPFVTGKALSQAEVTELYNIGRRLLGLA